MIGLHTELDRELEGTMALSRLKNFEASCRRPLREYDLTHFEVYTAQGEQAA